MPDVAAVAGNADVATLLQERYAMLMLHACRYASWLRRLRFTHSLPRYAIFFRR